MIPVLYKETETEFDSQGIGCLSDCITCYVSEKLNGAYELELTYPVTGIHYSDLKIGAIIDAIPADGKQVQHFRIETITKPIGGKVTVEANHISYQLSYVPVKPFTAKGAVNALQGLVLNSIINHPFSVWTDITNAETTYTQVEPSSFRGRLAGIEGSILDCFGGEYEFDNYIVKLHAHRGSDRGVVIEYGKNLTDLEQEESIDSVVTGIVPYWEDSETKEVVSITEPIESEYADKYPFKRTIVKDFSEQFEEKPTVEQLRAKTESYIKNDCVGVPQVSLDVSFVALEDTEEYKNLTRERINLGDIVTVRFLELGVDAKAKVIEAKYDALGERYDSLKIGSVKASLASTIQEITKVADSAVTKSILDSVMNYQKKLISGGLGGYVVTNYVNGYPSEIIIGDSPNIETMVNCLRLNKEGLGISKTGYEGPYVTAITGYGINASAGFFGELDGNIIKGGTIIAGALSEEVTSSIDNAQKSADEATEKANKAQGTADTAQSSAQDAYKKSQEAQAEADNANRLAQNAWQGIDDLSQVVVADSTGVKVKEARNSSNYSQIRSDGMHVFVSDEEVAKFGRESHIDNLAVSGYSMFGCHRAETISLEVNGAVGDWTAFYYIGDVK